MRKRKQVLLIVPAVVLAVALALVVGEVVQYFTYEVPTIRASSKTAYVVAYDGGFWFEASGDVDAPTAVGHDAGTPIPADFDVVVAMGWSGTSLDQIKAVSENRRVKISIPEAGVDLSYDRQGAYWSGPTLYDEYWIDLLLPITGFDPPGGSQVYANHFWCMLTGEEQGLAANLGADKKFPQGTYTVYYAETILQPTSGVDCIYDGPQTPYQAKPGTNVADPFTFTIGSPVGGGPRSPLILMGLLATSSESAGGVQHECWNRASAWEQSMSPARRHRQ